MCPAHPRRLLGLFIGLIAACSHRNPANQGGAGARTPSAEAPRPVLTAEDIQRGHGRPIEELLMERFPGVTVTRTADGSLALRIRGTTSLHGSTEPLYVLDGIEILAGPGGGLTGINPYDIASIEVVKDPTGTAMYGVRGANGVIIIKTKRPDQ